MSTYHLYGNFGEKFPSNITGIFFLAPKTGTGLSCTIYKIPVNFSLFSTWNLALVIQTNGTGNFGPFGKNGKKLIPRKALLFSRKNFHGDEPLHMNSPRNFRVFHTNSKRSTISQFAKHHVTIKRDLTDRLSSFQDVSVKFYPKSPLKKTRYKRYKRRSTNS